MYGGGFECCKTCAVVGDQCETGACYFFGPISGDFFCYPIGTKYVGDVCGGAIDCVAGAQCLDRDSAMTCYEVCTDACDVGVCTDTGLGFRVCVEGAAR